MANKRRPISQLPAVNRTATLERFFGSTVDHLFQPGQTAAISGWIGRVPDYNDPAVDFYKPEPTLARKKYQLEAAMVSEDDTKNVNDILFYDDLIARLSAEGALVSDPDRLFRSEFWSWAPPIDIDKVNNFQRYFWSDDSVPPVVLTLPGMEIPAIYKANGAIGLFKMPAVQPCMRILESDQRPGPDGTGIFPGNPQVLVDGIRVTDFAIVDADTILFTAPPRKGSTIEVYRYGNIGDGVRTTFAFPDILLKGIPHNDTDIHVYLNGRPTGAFTVVDDHVVLNNPAPANTLVTVTIFQSLQQVITGRDYFNIENIATQPVKELINGLKIRLVDPYVVFFGFDIKPNATFKWDEMRPKDFLVDGVGVSIHLMDLSSSLLGLEPQYIVVARNDKALSYFSRINRWVQSDALLWFRGNTIERQAKRPINEMLPSMAMFNYGRNRAPDTDIVYGILKPFDASVTAPMDDYGRTPTAGDIVLFGNVGNPALDNKFFIWPIYDDFTQPGEAILSLVSVAQEHDVFLHNETRDEYMFVGGNWIKCATPGLFPLYDLFDNDGVSLADKGVYPKSNFAGSRLFNFKIGTGVNDPVLGFAVDYDTYGAIMFENYLYTESFSYRDGDMIGFHYYLTNGTRYDNEWYKSSVPLPAVGSSPKVVVPLNLQANPNFDTPKLISRNNWFEHFASIVANQVDFKGKPYSNNNWQYTSRDLSRGTTIVQSRSPLLKLMMIMSENSFDLKKAIKFAEGEYTRYKLKVRQKIKENIKVGLYTDDMDEASEIKKVLKFVASNKTAEFAFSLSRIGGDQYFIPPTPATYGILPMVKPVFVIENGVKFLIGHDGSKTASVDDITDRLLFAMENAIFESRDEQSYVPETRPYVDEYDLISGKYRKADYSRLEANIIQQASFEDWARANNADYQVNSGYESSNPFTWNYGAMTDRDDEEMPGNWRGIYRYYFDTETPNITPWEMLGFAEQPMWWEGRYGKAPYARTNTPMWFDLEAGNIAEGTRAGLDKRFARPGLMEVLPVDLAGNLLDPVQARIITSAPPIQFASESWVFGDHSPIENLWRRSSSFGFAKATALFLMRPAQFVEDYWDKDNRVIVHDTQWIDIPTNDRAASSELMVHGEKYEDNTQKISFGIQAWLVEYMINHGQTPEFLGEMVRGLDVRLAHKMAGFTTRDRLHVDAESFGRIPDENIRIELYQSPGIAADFYSGVIIEHMGPSRWRVIGYNSIDPNFDIRPSDNNGHKMALSGKDERVVNPWKANVYYKVGMYVLNDGFVYEAIKNHQSMNIFEREFWRQDESGLYTDERLYKYLDAQTSSVRIPYTTVMHNRQDVVDFLYSYERELTGRGFGFPEGSWDESVQKFINWSKVRWAGGSFLTLSPGAREITYKAAQGFVLNLEGPTSTGSIINRTGHIIDDRKTKVDRLDDEVTITATGDDIYGVSLRKGEVEHVLIFNNRTIFDDIIYDTMLNARQERLKIHARRTQDWNGRYDAPGFMISQGQIVSNFDKSAEDLRYMFDIELADNTALRDHARHLIGFENRPYLTSLLLNETQQFELYQGMIQQKGAKGSLGKIMRSRSVEGNRNIKFMEEWAFRLAEFGAYQPRGYLEINIGQNDMRRQQQVVRFGNPVVNNEPGYLAVTADDARWVSDATDFAELETSDWSKYTALPNAGYVRTNEATFMVPTVAEFSIQVVDLIKTGTNFAQGQSVWIYNAGADGRWAIKYLLDTNVGTDTDNRVTATENHNTNGEVTGTRFNMRNPHGLAIGDTILITGPILNNYDCTGMFEVNEIGVDWFEIDSDSTNEGIAYDFEIAEELGPKVFKLIDGRFRVRQDAVGFPLANALVYIDDKDYAGAYVTDAEHPEYNPASVRWGVFVANAISGEPVRQQPDQIDAGRVASSLIYDQKTVITDAQIRPQPVTVARITPIDPMIGIIIGAADKEIDYKLEYDPAGYGEPVSEWTNDYVGHLWWDLSTCWFINPYTDMLAGSGDKGYLEEIRYRAANWSRLAPGARVDIYEWTKSYTAPLNSGLALHPDSNYVQSVEYSGALNKEITVYYFWVKNPTAISHNTIGRTLDAKSCADIISNPSAAGVPWMAAITPTEMLISGVREYLSDTTVLQLQLQLTDDDEATPHQQWLMVRPDDAKSQPTPALWKKLRDSLVGFDDNMTSVPDKKLHPASMTGIEAKQSMFDADKKKLARSSFVTMLNYQFARQNVGATQTFSADALSYATPVQEYLLWSQLSGSRTIANLPPQALYSKDADGIPMRTSDPAEMAEWFATAPINTRVLLDNRFSDKPSWSVWEKVAKVRENTRANSEEYEISIAKHYHHIVADLAGLNSLAASGRIANGEFVLVQNNEDFDGFWTVHRYIGDPNTPVVFAMMAIIGDGDDYGEEPSTGSSSPFELVNAQTYRTSDFFDYVDWYADGFSAFDPPVVTYANSSDRNKNENPIPTNLFVKILDNGSGFWTWNAYDGSKWKVVAQQLGTIELSPKFFENTALYGWNPNTESYDFNGDNVRLRDGSHDLRVLADAILDNDVISDLEKNELWFSMINFIHSSHDQVDWAFKTSFLTVVGFNEALLPVPVAKPDNTEFILSYVEEVKPYHVTVRDFARSYNPKIEDANTTVTDFDKPGYLDPETLTYRKLDANNPADIAIMQSGSWNHWLENVDLARKVKIDMKLDRIWFSTGTPVSSAADRIASFYQPSAGMKPKDLDALLKLDFKGTVLDGMTFKDIDANAKITIGGSNDLTSINGNSATGKGLQLRDGRVAENTPEDMVRLGAHDGMLIRAHDKWGAGAPRTIVKSYDVSREKKNFVDLRIGMVARDVLVFFDGIRGTTDANYYVSHLGDFVNVPLSREDGTRVQQITIHAFGYAANTTVLGQQYFVPETDGEIVAIIDLPDVLAEPVFYPEVTRNGQYIASTTDLASGTKTVTFAGTAEDQFVVTYYKGGNRETTSIKYTDMPARANPNGGTARFTAIYDLKTIYGNDLPITKPYASSIIVERNGKRLAPPRLYFAENTTEKFMGDDKEDISAMRVIDDTGVAFPVVAAAESDYTDIDDIRQRSPNRFVYWSDYIVFADPDADKRRYAITVIGTGEFDIDDATGRMSVYSTRADDIIRTIHWRNDAIMTPQTWSFRARASGAYRIATRGRKGSTWLTVNGRRLVEDIDYFVNPSVEGAWDVEAFEQFRWDSLMEVNVTIKNTLTERNSDRVVITTFEGPQNTPAIDWQHATLTPDVVRFKPNPNKAIGERDFVKENSAWATESHDMNREGGLLSDDISTDTGSFSLVINANSVPGIMLAAHAIKAPNANANVPGVLWIGAERIEYFKRSKNGETISIDQVRRGTKGTPRLNHTAGTPVRVEHQFRMPRAPLADITPAPRATIPDAPRVVTRVGYGEGQTPEAV